MDDKKPEPPRAADALGTLARRSEGSKALTLLIAVVGFVILALLGSFIFQGISGGNKTPEIPHVTL